MVNELLSLVLELSDDVSCVVLNKECIFAFLCLFFCRLPCLSFARRVETAFTLDSTTVYLLFFFFFIEADTVGWIQFLYY